MRLIGMNRLLLAAGIVALSSAAVHAQQNERPFYVGVQGGLTFLNDADNIGTNLDLEQETDTGFNFGGVVGYRVFPSFRVEAEVTYRNNDADKLAIASDGGIGNAVGVGDLDGQTVDARGDTSSISGMINGWFDVPVGGRIPFTPYLGGGIGLANVDYDNIRIMGQTALDDDDTVFAWQLGAGVRYPLTEAVNLSLDYRYFATSDPDLRSIAGEEFEGEYNSHNVILGATYSF